MSNVESKLAVLPSFENKAPVLRSVEFKPSLTRNIESKPVAPLVTEKKPAVPAESQIDRSAPELEANNRHYLWDVLSEKEKADLKRHDPSSFDLLMRRIKTFKLANWIGKPPELDAVNCARAGWINIGLDRLFCPTCTAEYVVSLDNIWANELSEGRNKV